MKLIVYKLNNPLKSVNNVTYFKNCVTHVALKDFTFVLSSVSLKIKYK